VPTRDGASARWAEARNILAVRLDNLGDVLMATPALAAILETLPAAKLTLLGSPAGAALVRHLPMIDAVIGWRAPWVRHATPSEHDLDARRFVDEIGARAFDAAVIFTTCTQSALPAALMCQMAGIPLRLAYSRENPYDLLSDWAPETDQVADGMRHEVTRQLALVAKVGFTTANPRLRFALDRAAHEAAAAALRAAGFEAGGTLCRRSSGGNGRLATLSRCGLRRSR
jgi:ADP-heptose:LPS heptosyltransferase